MYVRYPAKHLSDLNCASLRSHKDAVMEQEVMFRRNALFDLIYRRIVESYVVYVPTTLQWIMEMTLLLLVRVDKCSLVPKSSHRLVLDRLRNAKTEGKT